MKRLVIPTVVALGFAVSAAAAPITYTAVLSPEVAGATGTGTVTVIYDMITHDLSIDATFSGLSGTTTVSHIHCCTAVADAGTVGVAVTPGTLPGFPAGVQAGSYVTSPLIDLDLAGNFTASFITNFGSGTVPGAQAALVAGMNSGRAYFNIHTSRFLGGEIRGFLRPVPEPATLSLIGLGLVGAAVRRRRVR